jgi:hypothetical protein
MPTTLPLYPTDQVLPVPTQWADVTLAQFVTLFAPEPDDTRRLAEVLMGLEAGGLDDLAADDVQYIANLLAFAADPSPVLELLPTPGLPSVGSQPYGVLLLAQQRMEAEPERPWLSYGAHLLALYRVQLLWGKCDLSRVAACEAALLASPVTEVYADAAFFLNSYRTWLNDSPPTKPTTTSPQTTKSRRALKNSATALRRFWASIWPRAAMS